MSAATKGKLDPRKTFDVAKYAMILGNPLRPYFVEGWLETLLNGKHPTFANKVEVVATSGCNLKFLTENKATIQHPEMTTYKKLMMRVRAVKGVPRVGPHPLDGRGAGCCDSLAASYFWNLLWRQSEWCGVGRCRFGCAWPTRTNQPPTL